MLIACLLVVEIVFYPLKKKNWLHIFDDVGVAADALTKIKTRVGPGLNPGRLCERVESNNHYGSDLPEKHRRS